MENEGLRLVDYQQNCCEVGGEDWIEWIANVYLFSFGPSAPAIGSIKTLVFPGEKMSITCIF